MEVNELRKYMKDVNAEIEKKIPFLKAEEIQGLMKVNSLSVIAAAMIEIVDRLDKISNKSSYVRGERF